MIWVVGHAGLSMSNEVNEYFVQLSDGRVLKKFYSRSDCEKWCKMHVATVGPMYINSKIVTSTLDYVEPDGRIIRIFSDKKS